MVGCYTLMRLDPRGLGMSEDTTTVQVSVETWQYLNRQKRPGESMDDVLCRELGLDDDRDDGDDQEDVEADGSGERTYKAGEMVMQDAPDDS